MEKCNCRVSCNVCECKHNDCISNYCNLDCIEISHEKTQSNAVCNPHFCKSYCEK